MSKEAAELDSLAIQTIRGLSMDAVQAANSGHPGTPMALAPLGWLIFHHLRKHSPTQEHWADRDRFILSCGHASMLQYALLHLSGYDVSLQDIKNFRQWESKTPGHPEYGHTPGVEVTTGPLGQGIAMAVGMAMAERHLAARFNRDDFTLFDHKVWVIASDGDLMEGVSAEAASLAGHLKLGKIIAFWDDNKITIDGETDLSFSEDVLKRYEAYGWHVLSVDDGNDLEALEQAAKNASEDPRPSLIRVRTIIGYPSPNKQNTAGAHGAPLGEEEIEKTKEAMFWSKDPFFVPKELLEVTEGIITRGQAKVQQWQTLRDQYTEAFPELAAELESALKNKLPSEWDQALPTFETDSKGLATRKASGKIIQALGETLPNFVGGSADLTDSNNVRMKGTQDFRSDQSGVPQTAYFGIREHAMGAAVNGMALHGGVFPFGATFLVFSDYMRPAIRLAALMNIPSRFIFTHDSIGLGEDGPTHQPVEHVASLRAIPNLAVFRPGDANEVTECYKAMLTLKGPGAIVLTRQNLPTLDRSVYAAASESQKGAYILSEAENEKPDVILIATGSEVSMTLKAQRQLRRKDVYARVVSMPCVELFEQQSKDYQDHVLPPSVSKRVVVEAASSFGWHRWIGSQGVCVTVDTFGASAPFETVYEKYGITTEAIVERTLGLVNESNS